MREIYELALLMLRKVDFSPFQYLKWADSLLSNPKSKSHGRELVIRALDQKEKFNLVLPLLRHLVRKAGLYPYLRKEFTDHSLSEELLLQAYQTPFSQEYIFHSMQFKIYELLIHGRNVILSAPTSMGKSAIVDSLLASDRFKKVVIVLPTVALVDETRRRLRERFGHAFQIIHHGSQPLVSDHAIYVLTQERVNDRDDMQGIDLFVLDEFYKLAFTKRKDGSLSAEDERVNALNSALSKLLKGSSQFFMTGPFISGITGLSSVNINYTFVPTDYNTVALNVQHFNIRANDIDKKNERLLTLLQSISGPTIIYCRSASAAGKLSKLLISRGIGLRLSDQYSDWLKSCYHSAWDYVQAYVNGIGLHFGGLPRAIQQYTIDRFNDGQLPYLICTSTIIEGVNTVAKNVIIYDNRQGNFGVDRFTHGNIRGRAGRMGVHYVGNVYCMEEIPKGDEPFEVEIPLGTQDENTPISLLAALQPEHLTDYSQARFDEETSSSPVDEDLIRKNASFSFSMIKDAFDFVSQLSVNEFNSLLFNSIPNSGFSVVFTNFLYEVSSTTLRHLGLLSSKDVVHAKIVAYLFANSFEEYFRKQIDRAVVSCEGDEQLSVKINDELKIVNRLFSYTVPKALSLLEDLTTEVAERRSDGSAVSYAHVRSLFENYHLGAAWAGLEEMGIPIQTLQKLHDNFPLPADANLDSAIEYLSVRANTLLSLTEMDRHFITRAIGPPIV
ncbi:ski2-like helicase [Achromobacter spanius]|uniref:DEAD/DEAH box helicase n=1 Tax=Achromobacter spanius TaxID=217203 RepID=UPI000C2C2D98|nr:DEAD/DEAH box helicase [Achromobacter spanius]AUA58287.1 hypothetical protein CVS48_21075 [Achromobacter spanius]CAB3682405.1 hypothetical protein LMG5911_04053 [Achromobacter spanius]SPT38494.1 ski2-like helicase [Achromobacter denitrificans]VEE59617.1 ski2-like helicase [Achromobacter spanius]